MFRIALPGLLAVFCLSGANLPPQDEQRLAREIYKQIVEIKST
jgi:hypothetical protein